MYDGGRRARHQGKGANVGEAKVRTSESHAIRVDFVPSEEVDAPGRLGMTFAPGMKAGTTHGGWRWERDLGADMRKLKGEYETDVLVSVMEEHEYRYYKVPDLYERDEIEGVEILRFAIRDMGIPQEAESERYRAFVEDVVGRLRRGKNAVVHCRGGLGRTGTVAACVLIALGRHSAKESIDAVREAREGTIQTEEQEDFVRCFEESLEKEETS
jgi:protein-tyrosine phosphatase